MGTTSGWNMINPLQPRNLYWVGNSFYWNDLNNWSLTSGGSGGNCAPTPLDNIYFDANSFLNSYNGVIKNAYTAYCNDMSWLGANTNPTFADSASNVLKIYGSLNFIPQMTNF